MVCGLRNCPFHVPEGGLTECPHREGQFRGHDPYWLKKVLSTSFTPPSTSMTFTPWIFTWGLRDWRGKRRNARGRIYLCLFFFFFGHFREIQFQGCKFWPQICRQHCQVLGQLLSLPLQAHPTQVRGPAPRFHGLVIYFLPAISDSKTTFCICVQGNKFPEDKNYIL